MKTQRWKPVLIVGMMLLAACSPKLPPNTSPEGAAAIKGNAVVQAARAAVPLIDQQIQSGRLPQAVGIQVLRGVREVYVQAGTLANALDLVDQAKTAADAQAGMDKARAALASIEAALKAGTSGIGDQNLVKQILDLLAGLTQAIDQVKTLVSGVRPPGLAPAF